MQSTYLTSGVHLIGSIQLEVSDHTERTRKVNVCDVHRILPSDHIVSSISDEQVFGRRGKYINDPQLLKEVAIIDAVLHDHFPQVQIKKKWNSIYPAHLNCT